MHATSSGADAATFDLSGQRALVTGASRGLGRQIAQALSTAGAHVLTGSRDPDRAADAAKAVGGTPLVLDPADPASARAGIAEAEAGGGLDILVLNAGARDRRGWDAFTDDDLAAILRANVGGPFAFMQAASRGMRARGYGRILALSSVAGDIVRADDNAYATSKGALSALVQSASAALGRDGVTVNALAPGYFATETNAGIAADPAVAAWLSGRSSLGRWGAPSEIRGPALFLCSPAASFVTGQVLTVDGGMTVHY